MLLLHTPKGLLVTTAGGNLPSARLLRRYWGLSEVAVLGLCLHFQAHRGKGAGGTGQKHSSTTYTITPHQAQPVLRRNRGVAAGSVCMPCDALLLLLWLLLLQLCSVVAVVCPVAAAVAHAVPVRPSVAAACGALWWCFAGAVSLQRRVTHRRVTQYASAAEPSCLHHLLQLQNYPCF